jgi:acyl carrier protein
MVTPIAGSARRAHRTLQPADLIMDRWNLPMQAFDTDLRNRITKLVKGILAQNSLTADVTPSTKLVDAGLTSMDMVNLMLGVEAEFDFTIPQTEITPENFQSVETLERMVATQLQPATAA